MMKRIFALWVLASAAWSAGCDDAKPQPPLAPPQPAARPASRTETPAPATASTPVPAAAEESTRQVSLLGVSLSLSDGWKRNPPANQMRLAEAEVPAPSGDPAAACQLVFSTAGGSVQDNLDRWARQVSNGQGGPAPAKSDARTVDGVKVTVMRSTGSFKGMGDASPRPDWGLLGAVIEAPEGLLFAKMTGPASSVEAAAPAFDAMIASIKKH